MLPPELAESVIVGYFDQTPDYQQQFYRYDQVRNRYWINKNRLIKQETVLKILSKVYSADVTQDVFPSDSYLVKGNLQEPFNGKIDILFRIGTKWFDYKTVFDHSTIISATLEIRKGDRAIINTIFEYNQGILSKSITTDRERQGISTRWFRPNPIFDQYPIGVVVVEALRKTQNHPDYQENQPGWIRLFFRNGTEMLVGHHQVPVMIGYPRNEYTIDLFGAMDR